MGYMNSHIDSSHVNTKIKVFVESNLKINIEKRPTSETKNDGRRTKNDGRRTKNDGRRTKNDSRRTKNDSRRTKNDSRYINRFDWFLIELVSLI